MDADQTSKLIIYYVKVYLMVEYHNKADHKDLIRGDALGAIRVLFGSTLPSLHQPQLCCDSGIIDSVIDHRH